MVVVVVGAVASCANRAFQEFADTVCGVYPRPLHCSRSFAKKTDRWPSMCFRFFIELLLGSEKLGRLLWGGGYAGAAEEGYK